MQDFFQAEDLTARLLPATMVVLIFAASARGLRAVTLTGAVAGAVLAFLLYVSAGPGGFLVLLCVFLLSALSTRLGYARKLRQGTAERPGGRSAAQVLANLAVAALLALLAKLLTRPELLVGASAALAEAAADTVSSEVGQAVSDRAYLITNFALVPAGTNGGVSVPGTVAGIAAAVVVAWAATYFGLTGASRTNVVVLAAVAGTIADSLLGATLERRHLIGNNAVNLVCTAIAALLAIVGAAEVR